MGIELNRKKIYNKKTVITRQIIFTTRSRMKDEENKKKKLYTKIAPFFQFS